MVTHATIMPRLQGWRHFARSIFIILNVPDLKERHFGRTEFIVLNVRVLNEWHFGRSKFIPNLPAPKGRHFGSNGIPVSKKA